MPNRWNAASTSALLALAGGGFTRQRAATELSRLFGRLFTPAQVGWKARRLGVELAQGKRGRPRVERAVPFVERRSSQCAFPLWGEEELTGNVCGAVVRTGAPYCEAHLALCWNGSRVERVKRWAF